MTGITTRTTGMINSFRQANKIINSNSADIINIGRKFVNDPTWLIKEMKKRKIKFNLPNQYSRCF